jgi:hypothetical protein
MRYQSGVATTRGQRDWLASIWALCSRSMLTPKWSSWLVFVGAALLHALTPLAAHAYEDQATLGVGLGYAYATARALPHNGATLAVDTSIGLDDIWTARAFASYSLHPGNSSLSVLTLGAELLYLVDILEVVPYFGAGLDALGSWVPGAQAFGAEFGVHPVVGIDWLLSRDLALGIVARPVFLLSAWQRTPIYVSATVTLSLLFDL